ncbi:MAG: hypothetical protein L6Q37_04765 [Bdellovibrionaceae bacterium]|nr:hypothetical protein [Pseudobdellovibrionaceae bacterium]NUM58411.1 hypothetical protein [Pseudobdellovibrionaceae bacterium]
MKKLFFLIYVCCFGFHAAAENSGLFELDLSFQKILKELSKQKIQGNLDLFSLDQIEGINLSLKYALSAEPSYLDGYYTRIDRYSLDTSLDPGDWFSGWPSPIGFHIGAGSEVLFARQFRTQGEALNVVKNPPYNLKHLPINSQNVIQNLKPGDFVGLTGKLNLLLSAEAFNYSAGFVDVKGAAYIVLTGQFNIHFYKLIDNRVRIKILALKQNGFGVGVNSDEYSGYEALGLTSIERYVKGKVKRLLNFKPLTLDWNKKSSDLVMIDYVFDLNQLDALQAYDHFMSAKMRLKQLEILNPINNIKDLQGMVFSDLTEVEKLAREDKDKPVEQRRVDRLFQGRSYSDTQHRNFRLDLRLIHYNTGTNLSSSRNILTDRDNRQRYFLFDIKNPFTNLRFLWDFYGDDNSEQTSVLFETNEKFEPDQFASFNLVKQRVIRSVSEGDFNNVQEEVKKDLPPEVYKKISWQDWSFSKGDLVNGFFSQEMFFKTELLNNMIGGRNHEFLKEAFKNYILRSGPPTVRSEKSKTQIEGDSCQGKANYIDCYEEDIHVVAVKLSDVFSPNLRADQKRNSFLFLSENELFKQKGAGFLFSLIPQRQREDAVYYSLNFRAKNVKSINFQYGNSKSNEDLRQFLYIFGVLNNRSYDLRLFVGDDQNYKPILPKY